MSVRPNPKVRQWRRPRNWKGQNTGGALAVSKGLLGKFPSTLYAWSVIKRIKTQVLSLRLKMKTARAHIKSAASGFIQEFLVTVFRKFLGAWRSGTSVPRCPARDISVPLSEIYCTYHVTDSTHGCRLLPLLVRPSGTVFRTLSTIGTPPKLLSGAC